MDLDYELTLIGGDSMIQFLLVSNFITILNDMSLYFFKAGLFNIEILNLLLTFLNIDIFSTKLENFTDLPINIYFNFVDNYIFGMEFYDCQYENQILLSSVYYVDLSNNYCNS
jgi:hypothetical protein